MLQVWGRRNASNVMPVMWAVAELGLPHERHDVGGSFGGVATPAYRAMNPNGRIPTIDDDGFVLWESNAIVRYLCGRYGAGSLSPEDPRQRATADQWMEWHKTTAYPGYIDLFWATVRTEPALREQTRIAAMATSVGEILQILDAQLARHPYVAGDRLTMADIPIGPAIHRYLQLAVERPALPSIVAWHERLSDRPAFREHVMFPFGSTPAEWYMLEREGARS
jgi:glutathione S-transferase